jgi:hypothetical protein
MTLADRKNIARRYVELLPLGRIDELPLSPNFSAWSGLSGEIEGKEFLERVKILPKMFVEPLAFTIEAITAEEDRVAVKCRSEGVLVNGVPYDNQYHFFLAFDGDRLLKAHEYMNVKKAEIMFPVLQKIRGR